MQNKKYQLFCLLLSASVAASSPASTIMAATRTGSVAMSEEDWQEIAEEDSGEWDDDELFQDYLLSLFFQTPEGVSCCSLDTTGKSTLNETEKKLYNDLKPLITEVAEGKRKSTKFEIDLSGYGDVFQFTADNGTTLSKDNIATKFAAVVDTSKVWHALLADMPYELYWHDKTIDGWSTSYSYSSSNGNKTVSITKLTISMGVNAKYAEKTENTYNANQMSSDTQNTVQRAQQAAAKAKSIVDENAGKSDYDKLYNYMTAICDLTSYNTSAPGSNTNNTTEGIDPWQLIYVFDGDNSTNVVCEGYSKAFAYLCDLTEFQSDNIACYLVNGTMDGGTGAGGHMWNIVTMDDNRNYLVDVTNCDAGTIGSPDLLFLAGLPGTVDSNYTFTKYSGKTVIYTYGDDIKALYGTGTDSVLALADQKYQKKALETLSDSQLKSMVTIPSESTYSGQAVAATLTNTVTGTGTATIYYQKAGSTEYVTAAPKDAGTYKVFLDVAAGTAYNAVEKHEVGSFTIKQKSLSADLFEKIADQTYNGSEIKPTVTSATLKVNTDYTVTGYGNNTVIADGNGTTGPYVTVSGTGNYQGTVNLPFGIVAPAITGTVTISGNTACGQTLTAAANVMNTGAGIQSFQWYRKDSATAAFAAISWATAASYTLTPEDYGKTLKVVVKVANTTGQLEQTTAVIAAGACPTENVPTNPVMDDTADTFTFSGKDGVTYEYSLDNGSTWTNISTTGGKAFFSVGDTEIPAGQVQVRAKAVTGYNASSVISNSMAFNGKKDLAKAVISLSSSSFTYTGTEQKPTITVTYNGTDVDASAYDVTISSTDSGTDSTGTSAGTKAGTVTLTITAKDGTNYNGSTTKTYRIEPAAPEITNVQCKTPTLISTTRPSEVTLAGTVTSGGNTVNGTFALTAASLSAGTKEYGWKFTPEDKRNYKEQTGTISLTVQGKALTDTMIAAIADQTYTGSEIKPTITVKDGSKILIEGTDYEVSYTNNINAAGAAAPTVTITGKGNYAGTAKKTFTINKAKQAALSITGVSGKTYGDASFTLQTTGGSGDGAVTFSVPSDSKVVEISGNTVTIKHAGTVVITAEKSGGNNYENVTATYQLVIAPKKVEVQWPESTAFTYDGTQKIVNPMVSNAGGDTVALTVTGNQQTDAGTYRASVTKTDNPDYTLDGASGTTKQWSISKADTGITLGNLSQTEDSVSAVTASLSPASADASATVEYLVTKDGKETWTTELPKTAGNYKVRAFLGTAHAGKNLKGYADFEAAKTAGKAAEGTFVISKASSGTGGSGNPGGSSSGSGSTGSGSSGGSGSGTGSSGSTSSETQKPEGEKPGTGTEKPSEGTPGSETPETVTNPDGSTTTVSSETREDGTTVRVEETLREDGSRKTAVTESRPDGTTKTTTTAADSEGNTTSVTEKTTMDTVGKGTNAVVTVKKDGEGSVTSAKALVDLTGKSGRVSIDGATVKAITEAAGTDTDITMTVKDSKGKTLYTLTADSADLKAGNSLKVFKYSAKKGYVLVNAKTYKASKSGSVSVSLKDKAAYRLEDTKTAAKIEKQILNSVKPAKTSAKIKTGKSMKASLAGSFHQENAKSISYSTTDKKVVKVSKNGTVKALKKGTAWVKVKVVLKNGKTKTVKVKLTVK